jgi:hypothetical protein
MIFSAKTIDTGRTVKWVTAHILFIAFIILIGFAITYLPIDWKMQVLSLGIISLVCMFAFRFVTLQSIKQLANRG